MRNQQAKSVTKRVRGGSAGTVLLIVIVLAIAILITKQVMKKTAKDPDTCLNLEPWTEWRLRENNAKAAAKPSKEQADITAGLEYHATVNEGDEGRGEIDTLISPDGAVNGGWGGYYWKSKLNYDVQGGGFKGFVCPGKIYEDEKGKDPSKLYFIAKGKFLIHESDLQKKYHIRAGDLYVTGWLDADKVSHGKLVITSDEKYSETYDWKAGRPQKAGRLQWLKVGN